MFSRWHTRPAALPRPRAPPVASWLQLANNMTRKDVNGVIESLAKMGYMELKKSGAFLVPGFAKFVVIKKPATKERSGINPFTKEPTLFKAKPARKIIRARPVKAAKDAVS